MSFSTDLTAFCKKYDADIKVVVRKITFEAFSRIVLKTPVDTGRARANWGLSIGAPGTVFDLTKVDKTGSATLETTAAGVQSWLCQGSIFLTNNLPYIGALEYGLYPNPVKVGTVEKGHHGMGTIKSVNGFSIQAPQGMVRVTVEEMQLWIKSVIV